MLAVFFLLFPFSSALSSRNEDNITTGADVLYFYVDLHGLKEEGYGLKCQLLCACICSAHVIFIETQAAVRVLQVTLIK